MRVAVVPGVLALLPEYAALNDPVPQLRAACLAAAAWVGSSPTVLADAQGERVARALLAAVHESGGVAGVTDETFLVVANGSARRSHSSPGPYDDRAVAFDESLGKALLAPDPEALRAVEESLARELWSSTSALPQLADLLQGDETVTVDYDEAPYGVQYWVVRYER